MFTFIFELIFIIRPIIDLGWNTNLIFGINVASIIGILLDILLIIYFIYKKKIPKNRITITGIIMISYMLVITIIYANNFDDFGVVLRYMSALSFLFVLAPNINEKKMDKILFLFIIITIIPIIITFLQNTGIVKYTYFDYVNGQRIERGSGGYFQPSVLTRFCTFGFLYALYFIKKYNNKKIKFFLLFYIIIDLIAVFISYHRTGYLIIIVNFILWFYLINKKNFIKYLVILLIGVMLIIAIFFILYKTNIINIDIETFKHIVSIENVVRQDNGNTTLVLRGRSTLIDTLIEGFNKNPVYNTIFGNGINANKISNISMEIADMDFIRVIWNYGFCGFIIWIIHLFFILKGIFIDKQRRENLLLYNVALCVFVNNIIWGFTCEVIGTPNIMYHMYLICGYMYYNYTTKKENKNEENIL